MRGNGGSSPEVKKKGECNEMNSSGVFRNHEPMNRPMRVKFGQENRLREAPSRMPSQL
jgi:hypothetical protein